MKHLKTINEFNNSDDEQFYSDVKRTNSDVKRLLSEIETKNVNLPQFRELYDMILNEEFSQARVSDYEPTDPKNGHAKFMQGKIETLNGNLINFKNPYFNNYGSDSYRGEVCYQITCPGYNNQEDIDKLSTAIEDDHTSSISVLKGDKSIMLIPIDKFMEIYNSVNSWVNEDPENRELNVRFEGESYINPVHGIKYGADKRSKYGSNQNRRQR